MIGSLIVVPRLTTLVLSVLVMLAPRLPSREEAPVTGPKPR